MKIKATAYMLNVRTGISGTLTTFHEKVRNGVPVFVTDDDSGYTADELSQKFGANGEWWIATETLPHAHYVKKCRAAGFPMQSYERKYVENKELMTAIWKRHALKNASTNP